MVKVCILVIAKISFSFFTSLPTVYLLRFPCVKKDEKKSTLFSITSSSQPCKTGLGRVREPGCSEHHNISVLGCLHPIGEVWVVSCVECQEYQ